MLRPKVRDVMSDAKIQLTSEQTILTAVKTLDYTGLAAVPVVDREEKLLGVLTQRDVLSHLAHGGSLEDTSVGELALECSTLAPDDFLEAMAGSLYQGQQMIPVAEDGRLVGVLTPFDVRAQRMLNDVLGHAANRMNKEISPTDSMYAGSRGAYIVAGVSAFKCVRQALRSMNKSNPGRILDLPSGAGRVLRVLKAAFPEAHLTACDLDREGVDFCFRALGAEPVYSNSDPTKVELAGNYDLIWCGSLFTHLAATRWPDFLELLGTSLAPEGLLLFTTHGRHTPASLRQMGVPEADVPKMLADFDRGGFGYSESPYDLEQDWGLTIASPEWIRSQTERVPTLHYVEHAELAWHPPSPRQDVVTCVRPSG
jgi:CBS domain-containing protein/SAM-dependent methyltransferase